MAIQGYDFDGAEFARVLLMKFYPERTNQESALIRDYLLEHIHDFDRVSFSVHVGQGATLAPDLLPNVARAVTFSTQKRIDIVGYVGHVPVLIEAKQRIGSAVLGQLLTDRHLWLEERPDDPDPQLVAIGRESDEDSLRVLSAHGIDVFLYAAPVPA